MSIWLEEIDSMEIYAAVIYINVRVAWTVVTDKDVGRTSRERCVHEVFSVRYELNLRIQDRQCQNFYQY